MARPGDGVLHERGQAPVRTSPFARGRALVEHGGEQRMGEDHAVPVRSDHACPRVPARAHDFHRAARRRARVGRPAPPRSAAPIRVASVARRAERRRAPRAPRARGAAASDRRLPRRRGAVQCEREERIPARRLVQAKECRPREHPAQPPLQDPVKRTETERANMQTLDAAAVDDELRARTSGCRHPSRRARRDGCSRPPVA